METLQQKVAAMLQEGRSPSEIISENNAMHSTQEIKEVILQQDPAAHIPEYVDAEPIEDLSYFESVGTVEKTLVITGMVLSLIMSAAGLILIVYGIVNDTRIRGIPSGLFLLGIVLSQRIYTRMQKSAKKK
jgi:hypothetical protein